MCTIHILKCPSCNAITSANRHTCPLTPATQVCHANHTNYITTYSLPGGCTPCLTRVGSYHTLPAGAAFVVPPWQRSSFSDDSLVTTIRRSERYLARLRMLRKSLETRARRWSSGLEGSFQRGRGSSSSSSRRAGGGESHGGAQRRCHIWRWTIEVSPREGNRQKESNRSFC
ncbi:hypothetical protein CKAH01_07471 [Colletotrichum kahawae]|uniref:Uncharacterized protein n=1 Tax=Colletotrichum kahawae TaxID=34407 RepID=A0AAD9Y6E8_COLKA|nr:hypothetical protein CKAH01_07471 [Colletotrichum kahawae]